MKKTMSQTTDRGPQELLIKQPSITLFRLTERMEPQKEAKERKKREESRPQAIS
jgi:hypothetical protein